MEQAILNLQHLTKSFDGKKILDDLSIDIGRNEFVTLLGPSGCGKTTTLRIIGGFATPDEGKVIFEGKDITNLSPDKRHINTVFQKYSLFSHMSVGENIAFGLKLKKKSKSYIQDKIRYALKLVDLEGFEDRHPMSLSGGQQQRIGILRALAASPPIVLMDEPFSALDPMTRRTLQQEVRTLQQKLNKTFVFVTHDMAEALDLADVIIFMDHGRIVQMAPPEEMLSHPASGQIQDFLGKFIDLQAHKELTAADFMRTGVYTVSTRKGINECISKMQRHNVDTLIVVDDQARYQGTVSIADIRLTGHVVQTIEPLIRCNTPTVHAEDNAKDCFDQLISSGAPYLVVLDGQGQVAGIITKTSMASAMAEQLWG